jgi:hypothetical protein
MPACRHAKNLIDDMLFRQVFSPAQPDLFLADEIARLRLAPPDEAAN